MADLNKCYRVAWDDKYKAYVIKAINVSELKEFDENVFFSLEYAEMRLKELQTGKMPHRTSPKEFETQMWELSQDEELGTEDRHEYMDGAMCDLLTELGYGKGVEVFHKTGKWYS